MLAALVIFGAVACTENQEENIPEAKKEPVLSFVANINVDETRTDLKEVDGDWTTIWSGDDILYVYNYDIVGDAFAFVNSVDEPTVFKCTDERVLELIGEPVQIDNHDNFRSTTGKKGGALYADIDNFQPNANISLTVNSSFFRFSSYFDVTLELSSPDEENYEGFVLDDGTYSKTVKLGSGEDVWVAFEPYSGCTLTAKINNQVIKSKSGVDFSPQMIYNLGFLGVESGWEISDGTPFYTTTTPDLFVAKNVKLTANNFCLHKVGDTAWGAGAKYGLVTGGTMTENTAIGLFSANWANDITISNATTTAHDIYFDRANSRLYVMTVGKTPTEATQPTHSDWYNIAGSMNNWGSYTAAQKFVYSGDNVWHLVIDFKANDQFKVQLKNGWGKCYGYSKIQGGVGKDLFNSPSDDNAKAKSAGTYEIWVIPSHSDAPLYIIKR